MAGVLVENSDLMLVGLAVCWGEQDAYYVNFRSSQDGKLSLIVSFDDLGCCCLLWYCVLPGSALYAQRVLDKQCCAKAVIYYLICSRYLRESPAAVSCQGRKYHKILPSEWERQFRQHSKQETHTHLATHINCGLAVNEDIKNKRTIVIHRSQTRRK